MSGHDIIVDAAKRIHLALSGGQFTRDELMKIKEIGQVMVTATQKVLDRAAAKEEG